MEYDVPSKHSNYKLAILDMEVWMDSLTQSISCRNSVHTQELLRRLLNSSPLLDWKTEVAPVLSIYMARMKYNGYPEKYRVDTLLRALRIHDKMVEDDEAV